MDQNFATKADFKEHYFMSRNDLKEVQSEMKGLKTELQTDLKELKIELKDIRTEFKSDIKDLEHRLTVRMGVMLTASIGIISALISFKH